MKNKLFYFCGIMMPQNYFTYYSEKKEEGGGERQHPFQQFLQNFITVRRTLLLSSVTKNYKSQYSKSQPQKMLLFLTACLIQYNMKMPQFDTH